MLQAQAMVDVAAVQAASSSSAAKTYLWLVGNGGMGYNYNYYYYHSSIPHKRKVGKKAAKRILGEAAGVSGSGSSSSRETKPWASPCGPACSVRFRPPCGSFRKLGVPYFGVLIIRILLFRVLY